MGLWLRNVTAKERDGAAGHALRSQGKGDTGDRVTGEPGGGEPRASRCSPACESPGAPREGSDHVVSRGQAGSRAEPQAAGRGPSDDLGPGGQWSHLRVCQWLARGSPSIYFYLFILKYIF